MKTSRSCVALLSVLAMSVPAVVAPAEASAKDVLINSKWTSTPSDPLPKDIKTIRVQKPTYGDRANDDGFMDVNVDTRFEGLPYWYHAFWGSNWGYYGYGGHARNQRVEDDKFYRFVIGELERQLRKNRPDIRLTDIEDRIIRADARDDARARGRSAASAVNGEALHDAVIVVRFSLDVRDESKVERDKLHERLLKGGVRAIPFIGGFARAGMGPSRHVEWVRTVEVSCSMDLEAAQTGVIIASYSGVLDIQDETDRGIFGYGDERHADLKPVARIVKQLVSEHVTRFLGQVIPVERSERILLEGASSRVVTAVRKLNAGRAEDAAIAAKEAYVISRDRDHRAAFAAAKACERLGEYAWATTWMQRAVDLEPEEELYLKQMNLMEQEVSNRDHAQHYTYEEQGDSATKPGGDVVLVDSTGHAASVKTSRAAEPN